MSQPAALSQPRPNQVTASQADEPSSVARSSALPNMVEAAALRTIRRHADILCSMPAHTLSTYEAREIVRVDLAALEQIIEPVLRRLALLGLQRCASSQSAYLAELHDQV